MDLIVIINHDRFYRKTVEEAKNHMGFNVAIPLPTTLQDAFLGMDCSNIRLYSSLLKSFLEITEITKKAIVKRNWPKHCD